MNAKKLARRGDPVTSHKAAHGIVKKLGRLQRWAADCVNLKPGSTSLELSKAYCPGDPRTINRRLNECEKLGTVRRGTPRSCRVSGRKAHTWYPAAWKGPT